MAYHELDINLDFSSVDGFLNYYETRYVIHANDSAKEIFDNSFVGRGDTISPIFLMNELFENMNLNGNNYLQYMSDLKEKIDIINKVYYKEDGAFIESSSSKYKNIVDEYSSVNYYVIN